MRCPYCNSLIFPDTTICPNCKKSLEKSYYEKIKENALNSIERYGIKKEIKDEVQYNIVLGGEVIDFANLLLIHSGLPLIKKLYIENRGDFSVNNLQIDISIEPNVLCSIKQDIGKFLPHRNEEIKDIYLAPVYENFFKVKEAQDGTLKIKAICEGKELTVQTYYIKVQSYREWINVPELAISIVGMVTPNDESVESFLKTLPGDFPGYQIGNTKGVKDQIFRILEGLIKLNLSYMNIPVSYEGTGQKVFFPAEVLDTKKGACLDISVLLASIFERIGIEPLLFFVESHAFIGLWLMPLEALDIEITNPFITNREELLHLVEEGALLLLNSTTFTAGSWELQKSQKEAIDFMKNFRFAVDVVRTRPRRGKNEGIGITPINFKKGG